MLETDDSVVSAGNNFLHVIEIQRISVITHSVVVRIPQKRRVIDHQTRNIKLPIALLVRHSGKLLYHRVVNNLDVNLCPCFHQVKNTLIEIVIFVLSNHGDEISFVWVNRC